MNRLLSYLLIALLANSLVGCMDTSSSDPDQKKAADSAATAPTDNVSASTDPAEPAPFEVITLNDTIPSPRRELRATIDGVDVTVNYGSPSVKDRVIWGELVSYGEVWRTGANEATTIELSQDATIAGQSLSAGTYGLFTIPGETDWTLIFNETAKQWGAYDYDKAKDVMRVKVNPETMQTPSETMEFAVEGDQLVLMWDQVKVPMTVQANA
jgi:hypothetical protein